MVEHLPSKQRVAGSIPVPRSRAYFSYLFARSAAARVHRDRRVETKVTMGVNSYTPKTVMVVVAHPDDAEFMAAGTVAKWTRAGSTVTYVIVTNGDKGSEDANVTSSQLALIREKEQRVAGKILGVANFVFMGYPDGYLEHTLELRRDLARVIRAHRPEVVICFDPTNRFLSDNYVNHPDHRASGDATIDAAFPTARDRLIFPELLADGHEPHKVAQLWLGASNGPNTFIDIAETLEVKCEALRAHPSQLGEDVAEFARQLARWSAEGQDFEFGESFRRIVLETDSASAT